MFEDPGEDSGIPRHTERIPTRPKKPLVTERIRISGPQSSSGRLGMWLLLAALAMLFGAVIVGYLVIRSRAPEWPPPGSPALPLAGLWISTALLVIQSILLASGERSIRAGRPGSGARMLAAGTLVGIAFIGNQTATWMRLAADNVLPDQSLIIWGLYVLSFLHAVHVLAGIVPMILISLRAHRGRYTTADSEEVHLVGMYSHFLLVTWIVIMAVLIF
jgi:cytochrome c oxidase subunit 3